MIFDEALDLRHFFPGGKGALGIRERRDDPGQRVRAVRKVMREHRLTRYQMAGLLGVGDMTVRQYLNPNYTSALSIGVARRLRDLRDGQADVPDVIDPGARFHAAARRLFGRYYETGFAMYERRKVCAIRCLTAHTRLHVQTIYKHLPPYGPKFKPSMSAVQAFELAVLRLGGIV
jgi:predicted transcriptional regulator